MFCVVLCTEVLHSHTYDRSSKCAYAHLDERFFCHTGPVLLCIDLFMYDIV